MPPEAVACTTVAQSVSVTDEGLAVIVGAGVGQIPAPVPAPLTLTVAVELPSLTVTVALPKDEDGLARRMERMLPLTLATTLPLFEAAL